MILALLHAVATLWSAGNLPAGAPATRRLVAGGSAAGSAALQSTVSGVVVAHDNELQLIDVGRALSPPGRAESPSHVLWTTDGVAHPTKIAVSADRVAALDPIANEIRLVDLADGRGRTIRTGETPVDAFFAGRDLYVLDRDARLVERVGGGAIATGADPEFLRASNGRLYVYSRVDGLLQEIELTPFRETRRTTVAPFASAMDVDNRAAYLVYPRAGKVRTILLSTLKQEGEEAIGAVPVDLSVDGRTVVIADPSAKRVWIIEGSQSVGQSFVRGFLRGFLGLGLFTPRNSQFPTGVDRVAARGGEWIAYDSSSGTLYGRNGVLAKDIAPHAFAFTADGIVWWDDAVRRLHKVRLHKVSDR